MGKPDELSFIPKMYSKGADYLLKGCDLILSKSGFHWWDEMPWPKATWRRKHLFGSHVRLQSVTEGSQGRNSRQEPGAETMESAACWLTHRLMPIAFYRVQDHLPRKWCHLSGLGPTTSISPVNSVPHRRTHRPT